MKAWLANLMWDALRIFAGRVHDWAFDPQRHARIRMAHRERWWDYYCKAMDERQTRRHESPGVGHRVQIRDVARRCQGPWRLAVGG
jgi:hypothetical protein